MFAIVRQISFEHVNLCACCQDQSRHRVRWNVTSSASQRDSCSLHQSQQTRHPHSKPQPKKHEIMRNIQDHYGSFSTEGRAVGRITLLRVFRFLFAFRSVSAIFFSSGMLWPLWDHEQVWHGLLYCLAITHRSGEQFFAWQAKLCPCFRGSDALRICQWLHPQPKDSLLLLSPEVDITNHTREISTLMLRNAPRTVDVDTLRMLWFSAPLRPSKQDRKCWTVRSLRLFGSAAR